MRIFPRFSARPLRLALLGAVGLGLTGVFLNSAPFPARAQENATVVAPQSFADVVDRVKGAVVSIYVASGRTAELPQGDGRKFSFPELPEDHPLNEFFKRFNKENEGGATPSPQPSLAQGSGFVISADGYVVTNNHVIDGATKIQVSFDEQQRLDADLVGTDPRTDIALLKIKGSKTFDPVLNFSKADVRVGDWVLAVGNPFGLGGTVTAGIVSARGRDIGSGPYDFIQIDAAVNRGNSGGPAFNLAGEVIGVNTAIFSPSGGNVGIAFAVPAGLVEQVVAQLKDKGSVSRGWLGVHIQNVTDEIAQSLGMTEPHGALITKITEGGPAEGSKLEVGDAVVTVNGEKIGSSRDLARKVAELAPATDARLQVLRDGKEVEVIVKLGQFPGGAELAKLEEQPGGKPGTPETSEMKDLGLSLAPASTLPKTGDKAQEGVLITKVAANSEAADKGLQSGDIILEVAGEKVVAPADVAKGVEDAKGRGRKAVLFRVKSGEQERFIALALAKS